MLRLPTALALSFAQLGDSAILKVLAKSLAITLAVFALLGWALTYAFAALWDKAGIAAASGGSAILGAVAAVVLAWLLFRVVALFVIQFFADDVVQAVERRHYPTALAAARSIPFKEEVRSGVSALLRTLAVNALALPFAFMLLYTAIGPGILFWAVNAWLLGRELQDMVWLRHRRSPEDAQPLGGPTRFALGGVVAALLLVPFANLLAPVLGAASATHLVHRSRHAPA